MERLGTTADDWSDRMKRLVGGKLFGNFIATTRERLREVASTIRVQRLANLCTKPTG